MACFKGISNRFRNEWYHGIITYHNKRAIAIRHKNGSLFTIERVNNAFTILLNMGQSEVRIMQNNS